jgi:hypothetical protein
MTSAPARAHINSSRLVRFLTENALLSAAPAQDHLGQKLGDWLNFRQAIALHGILTSETPQAATNTTTATATQARRAGLMTAETLARHVEKVRADLVHAITHGAPAGSGMARIELPAPELDDPVEPKTAFEPYRRFYAAHQRQMENSLRLLRAQVRNQLSKSTPALQQLATLDAAFEQILSEREAVLLGKVSKLHEKRFAQALKLHLKQQAEAALADTPQATHNGNPSAWLMPLRQALRTSLLAELDTRLQPTLGLLEAFTQENPKEK